MNNSIFKVKNWNEEFVIDEKIAHAKAEYTISGELDGHIDAHYSIFYSSYSKEDIHKSSSMFKGFMYFNGMIKNKQGSFVLEDCGSFIHNTYNATVKIVKDSGTGAFSGITGEGKYYPVNDSMVLELDIAY